MKPFIKSMPVYIYSENLVGILNDTPNMNDKNSVVRVIFPAYNKEVYYFKYCKVSDLRHLSTEKGYFIPNLNDKLIEGAAHQLNNKLHVTPFLSNDKVNEFDLRHNIIIPLPVKLHEAENFARQTYKNYNYIKQITYSLPTTEKNEVMVEDNGKSYIVDLNDYNILDASKTVQKDDVLKISVSNSVTDWYISNDSWYFYRPVNNFKSITGYRLKSKMVQDKPDNTELLEIYKKIADLTAQVEELSKLVKIPVDTGKQLDHPSKIFVSYAKILGKPEYVNLSDYYIVKHGKRQKGDIRYDKTEDNYMYVTSISFNDLISPDSRYTVYRPLSKPNMISVVNGKALRKPESVNLNDYYIVKQGYRKEGDIRYNKFAGKYWYITYSAFNNTSVNDKAYIIYRPITNKRTK